MPEAVKETVTEKGKDDVNAKEDIIEKVPCKDVTQVEEVPKKTEDEVKSDSTAEEKSSTEVAEKLEKAPTVEGNGTALEEEEAQKEKSTNGTAATIKEAETPKQVEGTKLSEASSEKNMPDNVAEAEKSQKPEETVENKKSDENVSSEEKKEEAFEVTMEQSQNESEKTPTVASEAVPEITSIEAAPEKMSSEVTSENTSDVTISEKTSDEAKSEEATKEKTSDEASLEKTSAEDTKEATVPASKEGDEHTSTEALKQEKTKSDSKVDKAMDSQAVDQMDTDEVSQASDEKTACEDKKTPEMEVEEMETDSNAPAKSAEPSDAMETDGQNIGKSTEADTSTGGQESATSVANADVTPSSESKSEAEKQPVEEIPKSDETPASKDKNESSGVDAMEVEGGSSDSKEPTDVSQATEPKSDEASGDASKEPTDISQASEPKSDEASGDSSKETVTNVLEKTEEISKDNTLDALKNKDENEDGEGKSSSGNLVCERAKDKENTEPSSDIPLVKAEKSEGNPESEKSECPIKDDNSNPEVGTVEARDSEEKPVESKEGVKEDNTVQTSSELQEKCKQGEEEKTQASANINTKESDKTEDTGDKPSQTEQKPVSAKELTALINPPYKPPQIPKDQESSNQSGAGGSREIDPKTVNEIQTLMIQGKCLMNSNDYFTAADTLGKACEIAGKLYGDLAVENAELFYLYGCAMLECAKNENPVLGEGVKEQEEAEEDNDENAEGGEENTEGGEENTEGESNEATTNGDEQMEVENGEAVETEKTEEEDPKKADENGVEEEDTGETTKEGEEDDDSSLKVAWDMFELAKHLFQKLGNDLRLSDTYIKLGEVSVESGHSSAIEDMKNALEIRKKCASENERLIAETHFHIGLAYATFQSFEEAIESFKMSKSIIQSKIDRLKESNSEDSSAEIKELSELIPDLDDKIQDMEESKKVKANAEEGLAKENGGDLPAPTASAGSSKEVSNISHLIKRKRKLEEVTSDLLPSSKQPCTESTTESEPAPAPMEASN